MSAGAWRIGRQAKVYFAWRSVIFDASWLRGNRGIWFYVGRFGGEFALRRDRYGDWHLVLDLRWQAGSPETRET